MSGQHIPGPSRWPLRIGVVGTLVWLIAFAGYVIVVRGNILSLAPSGFGDFLSGAFAPLVFLWLVVGYFQQANELRLQVHELTEQVAANQALASAAVSQGRRDVAEVQPAPRMIGSSGSEPHWVTFSNNGGRATDLSIGETRGELVPQPLQNDAWDVRENLRLGGTGEGWMKLLYRDVHRERREMWLYFKRGKVRFRAFGEGPLDDPEELTLWLNEGP